MMKKTSPYFRSLMIWSLFAVALFACDTANNIEDPDLDYFVKYYGGDGNQYGVDMLALSDGTFLLLGNYKEGAFNSDVYLIKVDAVGELIWETRIGENDDTHIWNAKDLEPTLDGSFIVLADFQNNIGAHPDMKLLKISANGDLVDSVGFGTIAPDYGSTVTPVDDGSFVVSGTTELTDDWNDPSITDPDVGNVINYRFDANLDPFATNSWAPIAVGFGGRIDVAVKAFYVYLPDPDDPLRPPRRFFYTFGYSNAELFGDTGLKLFYFLRYDEGGQSNNLFPGRHTDDTRINFVLPVASQFGGGYLAVGSIENPVGNSRIFVGKLNSILTFIGYKEDVAGPIYNELPLPNNLRGVSAANSLIGEQGYLILGNEVRSTGATNLWLSKIDQSKNVLWSTTIGSEAEEDTGAAIHELPDGKIVILGTMGLADNQSKMAFIKINRRGKFLE